MQLPGQGVFGPPKDRDEALKVLRRALELGVNHIDTAQFYGPNVSNELIRDALYPYPEDLAIVSKVGARRNANGGWIPAQSPAELRFDVEENLRTLQIDQLTVVNLRRREDDDSVPIEEQIAEMMKLREEGQIAGIGLSTVSAGQLATAMKITDVACVQNPFSILDRKDIDVLKICQEVGIAYVPYFPLGSAFPNIPKVVEQPIIQGVAARLGISPAQVGLAWLLAQADNILLIPGTSSLKHLEENLAVEEIELSPQDLIELDRLS
jgi:aryl-alcohol dehydrogenase-like predicted oxidoreductase